MPTIERDNGLRITLPSSLQVLEPATGPARRATRGRVFGAIPLPGAGTPEPVNNAILQALEGQEMQLVDKVEIAPKAGPASPRRRGTRSGGVDLVELDVPLTAGEDAVVLLEQDGMYSWSFAEETRETPATSRRRGPTAAPASRRARFRIELSEPETPPQPAARRGAARDFFFGKVKAFVLKFAARIAVGQAMKFLERNVRRGLIEMAADSPTSWSLVASPSALRLPAHRPARVLLFVHGTFSSTIGAFGALGETPWGQKLLAGARASYDLTLGFDHPTLSADPLENATDLLNGLQSVPWPLSPRIDVVTHSRGALVVRSLIEQLLPVSSFKPQFGRVVFVGATNAGTELARTENWQELVDLYTNLAVGTCRLLGMIPQAKSVTLVLQELIQGIGAFVKYSATHTVEERAVPGLAAMEPDGDFVTVLNRTQTGQPTPEASDYRAVTSAFKPRLQGDHQPQELPRRFLQWLAGAATTQLMKEANDLVVHTASMTAIDPHAGHFIKASLDFGENPQIYHTNYFTRPEVANALGRWLGIIEPAAAETRPAAGGRLREAPVLLRRGRLTLPKPSKPRRTSQVFAVGQVARREVPATVDTDIVVTSAEASIKELRGLVREKVPSYVVVRREHGGRTLNYALGAEEVLTAKGTQETVGKVFDLHETDESDTKSVYEDLDPAAPNHRKRTTTRSVVFSGDRPVGVVPEKTELLDATALAALARTIASPATEADLVQVRRAMPTLRAAAPKITCHFHAEMDSEVLVQRVTTVEVLISREVIGRLQGASAAGGQSKVDPDRKILVQVIPKANFALVNEDEVRLEIDPPAPGVPQSLYFDVRPTHTGAGTLWVVARQGQVPLVTLELKPQIVTRRTQPATVRDSVDAVTSEAPRLSAPLHQLFILEQINGTEISYYYQLELPGLDRIWESSKPFRGDRTSYVTKRYKEIEDRWLSSKHDFEDFAEELKALGADLFDELFPASVQQALWKHRDAIQSIQVISTEPFIPWELVFLREPGKPLSSQGKFLGQMGLVRWLHEASWPPEGVKVRTGRVRYVIPEYPHPDYRLQEAEKEKELLEREFKAQAVPPEAGPVRKLISQPGSFDLLHFACHGAAEGDDISNAQLLMQGRIEDGEYIPEYFGATVAEKFGNLTGPDGNRPMVVLNACQAGRAGYKLTGIGGFSQAFLKAGAGIFIGTLWSVGDSPARTFTEALYTSLRDGKNLSQAAITARAEAQNAGDATWLAYAVYGHPHTMMLS